MEHMRGGAGVSRLSLKSDLMPVMDRAPPGYDEFLKELALRRRAKVG